MSALGDWVQERLASGWILGEIKDEHKKTSPYLVPYGELSEEIKELDRDTIRNIPNLLDKIGMAIYLEDQDSTFAANQPLITRDLPGSYTD